VTFQAYLDNIRARTGKGPDDFHAAAKTKRLLGPELNASRLVAWLKEDFGLGHGHAMAIWHVFKQRGWAAGPKKATAVRKPQRKRK
jgi:hypothetical protein